MHADIIINGNAIFTGLKDTVEKLSIAISNRKIIAIGDALEIERFKNNQTKIIDSSDNLVMPGFHDSHLHLMAGILFTEYSCQLSDTTSADNALELLRRYANKHKDKNWIIGTGWDHTYWGDTDYPTKNMIDAYIADRPVFLLHAEGHYAWVNSKALEISGVTERTSNPNYGIIHKMENGEPSGILIETAISLVGKYAYEFSIEQKRAMLNRFLEHAASLGVTSVNDLYMSRAHEKIDGNDVYEEFDKEEKLTTRIHVYPPLNGDLNSVKKLEKKFNSPRLKISGLKQFIDGVITGYTALMLQPYKDKPSTHGEISFPQEQLQSWVNEADSDGYQIRFHSIGDGAVRLGLDLFENAQKENGKRDSRHSLEHVEVISPEDLARFKELGVQASIQPTHMALMPRQSHTDRVSKEKYPYLYTNKMLVDAGAVVPYSSDYPIVELNPLLGIYHAITRKDYTMGNTWNEQEKTSLSQALRAYTIESAYSVFREDELGTLEVGKYADIIILDSNLFDISAEEILNTRVETTIMDGEIVYSSSNS